MTTEEMGNEEQSASPEMVPLHEASTEDLDAALEEAQKEESLGVPKEELPDETPSTPVESPEKPQVEGEVAPSRKDASMPSGEPSPKKVYTEEEIQAILADNERRKKEGNQKELFIQHRNNELGRVRQELAESRRQLAEMKARLENGLEDRFQESPVQAVNDRDKIKEIDQQLANLDNQEERASRVVEAQTFFLRHVDTEKITLDDVAEVLKVDGIDERYVAQFKANPWEFTTPEALVQMGKRAMDRKQFSEADNDRRVLAKHVLHLNAQLEQLKGKPRQVMAQVQRNLNQPPPITSASVAAPQARRDVDPTKMSTAELDAALRAAMN